MSFLPFNQRLTASLLLTFVSICCLAQHELPRHHSTEWSPYTIEEMQGDIIIPVVFINFTVSNNDNETSVSSNNKTEWIRRMNDACSNNHMLDNGSVNDWFYAQSYGKTNVTFEEVGEYKAPGKAADYYEKSACAVLACDATSSLTDVDWSRYDRNGDKGVDCVLFIFAGHADGDNSSRGMTVTSIYPFRDWMTNRLSHTHPLGDHFVDSFVFANNLRHKSSGIDNINTLCHELCHGILDLTDYYRNLNSYMGQYDAMCYGFRQLDAAGDHCCDMCSFNRMYMGWLNPCELSQPGHVKLRPLSSHAEACIIFDDANPNHFFMLENRAKDANSWDANLPAGGLIVTEVNFNRSNFEYHNVNGGFKKDIRLICAATGAGIQIPNDTYYNFDQTQIPYGIGGRTTIGSNVSSVFATKTVTNITVNADNSIEFDFMGGGEDIELGISQNTVSVVDASRIYDLMGREMTSEPRAGVYIKGGKTYLVR